jgi:plastocyanin
MNMIAWLHALRSWRIATAFALVAFAASLTPSAAFADSDKVAVNITRFAFAPKDITVAPGTTIVWTNHDATPHTVTSRDKSFGSKGLDTNDTFEHTFASEGDFAYICAVHPFMTGTVHVRKP